MAEFLTVARSAAVRQNIPSSLLQGSSIKVFDIIYQMFQNKALNGFQEKRPANFLIWIPQNISGFNIGIIG